MPRLEIYAIALGALLIVGACLYAIGHHAGYREREEKDEKATALLQAKVDKETQALRDKATEAETRYAVEHQQLEDYRASHPILDVSRLCDTSSASNLSAAKGTEPGSQGAGTPAAVGAAVPATNSWSGEDRRAMLTAFAALFDEQNARLREWQNR